MVRGEAVGVSLAEVIGASAGASLAVAIKLAQKEENKGKLIVPLLPDNGERYLSEDLQKIRPEVEESVGF